MANADPVRLVSSLDSYATLFRVVATIAAAALAWAGYTAASLSGFSAAVALMWAGAIVVMIQGFWAAAISNALAIILVRGNTEG